MWCASAGEWGSEAMMSVTHKKKIAERFSYGRYDIYHTGRQLDCPYVVQRALFLGLEAKETLF